MNEFKKCSVVMLPTNDNKAIIHKSYNSSSIGMKGDFHEGKYMKQHLYIYSDDKLQVGDWAYFPVSGMILMILDKSDINSHIKKIIATTDKSLNLPEIPKEFLREFCKKKGIWEVDVEYEILSAKIMFA